MQLRVGELPEEHVRAFGDQEACAGGEEGCGQAQAGGGEPQAGEPKVIGENVIAAEDDSKTTKMLPWSR